MWNIEVTTLMSTLQWDADNINSNILRFSPLSCVWELLLREEEVSGVEDCCSSCWEELIKSEESWFLLLTNSTSSGVDAFSEVAGEGDDCRISLFMRIISCMASWDSLLVNIILGLEFPLIYERLLGQTKNFAQSPNFHVSPVKHFATDCRVNKHLKYL